MAAAPAADVGPNPIDTSHATTDEHHGEHHGLPPAAPQVFDLGPFAITNSMIATWIAALVLILFAQIATRNVKDVPTGAQNFWELMVEGLYNFLGELLGPKLVKASFWFFATCFIFITFANWMGMFPGVGTVGWDVTLADGTHEFRPWLRGANADLNMTSAMALVFFFMWFVWSLKAIGAGGMVKHIFGGGGDEKGFMKLFLMAIFMAVGVIEIISILFRPVSLSFRLFGNVFAGENILESMTALVPWWGALLAIPFYFLELLVGIVQAFVFTLLTAVFTALMATHDEHHDEEHEHGHEQHAH